MTRSALILTALTMIFQLSSAASAQTASPTRPAATQPKTEKKPVQVAIETSLGSIELELDNEKAPITVANFLAYVDEEFYNGLVFHRVINSFMIQGGGFDKDLKQRPTKAPIKNEAHNGLKNMKGTIAMARTPDPHSASSQFFINLKDNDFLNYRNPAEYGYAVFGKVTKGLDVVEKIGAVPTGYQGPMGDVPQVPVIIKSISRK